MFNKYITKLYLQIQICKIMRKSYSNMKKFTYKVILTLLF